MRADTFESFNSSMFTTLRSIVVPGLRTRASKKLTLSISPLESRQTEATVDLVVSAKYAHVHLQAHVFSGRLHRIIEQLQVPRERNNLMARGVFFLTTLSEKNKEFSPDIGGARLLYDEMPTAAIAEDIGLKIRSTYLPIIESVLCLSPTLATNVLERPECFSYPLTILAILQRLGVTNTYSEALAVPKAKQIFKKEWGLDIQKVLGPFPEQ
jgi:hypothetical protein